VLRFKNQQVMNMVSFVCLFVCLLHLTSQRDARRDKNMWQYFLYRWHERDSSR
jgi:hypothetical protein